MAREFGLKIDQDGFTAEISTISLTAHRQNRDRQGSGNGKQRIPYTFSAPELGTAPLA